ncbi:MAG: signal recognition particle-docking protein FtsY [Gammaproteobacteria bacterium]|jgi:fused signal recognition particle receptor|nr:signal recognition particle-docking protein FtsY [Gammaproteobacteria bacterium]MBT3490477.1 signal recognition particle-docking protein FtsY [Gammaproteobacteria bacterium]MBT3717592.1 signal recognition particle-docking protein FtsY [Gammaproteobacteria bacterium]MBT3845785.1 signal recognition particle-docking protein FtsY [Gammaproteobacteria bacterium]MBT3893607.1 signal recognition particle-docking protein FtsY [Gammaproteobacteria bacterium]
MFGFGKNKEPENSKQPENEPPPRSESSTSETAETESAEPEELLTTDKKGFFSRFKSDTETAPAPDHETTIADPQIQDDAAQDKGRVGLFGRLRERLTRTRHNLGDGLGNLLLGKKEIDDELLEELETRLLMADVGIEATETILAELPSRLSRRESDDPEALMKALQEGMRELLIPCEEPLCPTDQSPYVILMIGINGAGKTTTIGKLAKQFQQQGKTVMLAAGDTFRAAAVEQLQTWGERNQIPVVAQQTGADSASVLYDAVESACAKKADILIADTAGRLHTQSNLMEELKKVKRVMQKLDQAIPHEVMLILDAGTGQNGVHQAQQFHEAIGVTGITLTKLDGTAKGGVIFAISKQLGLPIRFIGVGEGIDDLRPFKAQEFVEAIIS